MWRIIKWIFFILIIGSLALWITDTKVGGKTVRDHLKPLLDKPIVKEGVRDLRQLVGEGLKAAGEAISEDVTDSERKQLDDLVKEELMKGKPIEGAPGQKALPPQAAQPSVQSQIHQPRPTAEQMLQQAKPQTTTPTTTQPVQTAPAKPATAVPTPTPVTPKQQATPQKTPQTAPALDEAY